MERHEYEQATTLDFRTCHRGNASHTRDTLYGKHHSTSPSRRSSITTPWRLRTPAHLLCARTTTSNDFKDGCHIINKRPSEEPSLIDIVHDLHLVQQRLALAEHIHLSTQQCPFQSTFTYNHMDLPTGPRSVIMSQFHMEPHHVKPFAFAAAHMHPLLPFLSHPPTLQSIAQTHYEQ